MQIREKFMNMMCIFQLLAITAFYAIRIAIMGKSLRQNCFHADDLITAWAKNLLQTVKVTVNIQNPHEVDLNPSFPTIIMSNHGSLFDIPISYLVFQHRLRMIGKKELFRIPIFGTAMKHARHISMDRSNPRIAIKNLKSAQEAIQDGVLLWVAPEGTRSPDGSLQPFKSGGFKLAQASGANIIPITIHDSHLLLAKNGWMINRHQTIDVSIGEVIQTKDYKGNQGLKPLMQKVSTEIAKSKKLKKRPYG